MSEVTSDRIIHEVNGQGREGNLNIPYIQTKGSKTTTRRDPDIPDISGSMDGGISTERSEQAESSGRRENASTTKLHLRKLMGLVDIDSDIPKQMQESLESDLSVSDSHGTEQSQRDDHGRIHNREALENKYPQKIKIETMTLQGRHEQSVNSLAKMTLANAYPLMRTTHVQNLQAPRSKTHITSPSSGRRPPKLIRLTAVGVDTKRPLTQTTSLYFEDPRRFRKVITWDEANNARPPLRIDMEGPTPWSYSPRNKPLSERNAPAWTFGSKCSLDKEGGSRTSWAKTWFQTPHVWNHKVDFASDTAWPTPNIYRKCSLIGQRQNVMATAPAYSLGKRRDMSLSRPEADKEPCPADYDRQKADKLMFRRMPAYTHQFRREGTILWPCSGDETPGPGSYSPIMSATHMHRPAFSIQGIRREKSHELGPYATF